MLGGSKSDIYVSIAAGDGQPGPTTVYRRKQHVWIIAVEPHKLHFPGMPHPEPVHNSSTSTHKATSHSISSSFARNYASSVQGTVLLAESIDGSAEDVHKALVEKLKAGSSEQDPEDECEDDPDDWMRKALHVLQSQKLVDAFDVNHFMSFAHAYAAGRDDGVAPALVAYPRGNKDHEKKAKSHNIGFTYPMALKGVSSG